MADGILVRAVAESPVQRSSCGASTRVITYADGPESSLHVAHIRDARCHYHLRCTETYYVLNGEGQMEVGDAVVTLRPGVVVRVPPGVPHRAFGDVEAIVFGVPAWQPDDEYYPEEESV